MTQSGYMSSPVEGWQEFVAWDGEDLLDPIFDGDTTFEGQRGDGFVSNYRLAESLTSEQPYLVSAPPSVIDEPPSLDYTVSAPPSILGGSSSFGQNYCTSPSFETNRTSPLLAPGDYRYFGSFDACDSSLPPAACRQESPVIDTRYERILDSSAGSLDTATENVFNPYVAGSSHSFSGLDVKASQVLNAGTWVEQPQIIEPIAEVDEYNMGAAPIAIPQIQSASYNDQMMTYPRSVTSEQYHRTRAVTIPQANKRPSSFNHRAPPILSVSPITNRRSRGSTPSRSNSRNEGRRKAPTPSPTPESLGFVTYQFNAQTNRLAPTSTEGLGGRVVRGRKRGLTAEQRENAALMRVIGACSNCKRRKEKCDPGTPCKSCLEHYKGDLVNHPCRDRVLSDLSSAFLSDRLGWHPTARPLDSFTSPHKTQVSRGIAYTIPLQFGFGPELHVPVHALHIEDSQTQFHEHIIYPWPPGTSAGTQHTHVVLPAVLTSDAMSTLMQTLDNHLSSLVSHHFRMFPLFISPLRILREVYVYFRSLRITSPHYRTLNQALKLLVLVHIGGDITLPPPASNATLAQLMRDTMDLPSETPPTPCFIRAQFGAVMPGLALGYMKHVLAALEQLLLNRDCDEWPITLALLTTVLMTVESIHYHAAKVPYHTNYDAPRKSNPDGDRMVDDEGVKTLLDFYSSCFIGCHSRLRPGWEGEASTTSAGRANPDDVFIESVRDAIKKASAADGYLSRKAGETRQEGDMGFFFDRLVARLMLLKRS